MTGENKENTTENTSAIMNVEISFSSSYALWN